MSPDSSELPSRMAFSPQLSSLTNDSIPQWNLTSFGFCKTFSRVSPPPTPWIYFFISCSVFLFRCWRPRSSLQASFLQFYPLSQDELLGSSFNSVLINLKSMLCTSHSVPDVSHCVRNLSMTCVQAPQTQPVPPVLIGIFPLLLFFSIKTALSVPQWESLGSFLNLVSPASSTSYSSVSPWNAWYIF